MIKEYIVEESVKDWMLNNTEQVFSNVLESCELHLGEENFEIMRLRTITGITTFKINDKTSAVNALKKCETYFVKVEEYEKAARARDCVKLWDKP
jgi:hypothetical protein